MLCKVRSEEAVQGAISTVLRDRDVRIPRRGRRRCHASEPQQQRAGRASCSTCHCDSHLVATRPVGADPHPMSTNVWIGALPGASSPARDGSNAEIAYDRDRRLGELSGRDRARWCPARGRAEADSPWHDGGWRVRQRAAAEMIECHMNTCSLSAAEVAFRLAASRPTRNGLTATGPLPRRSGEPQYCTRLRTS